jgi:hypothetical protein
MPDSQGEETVTQRIFDDVIQMTEPSGKPNFPDFPLYLLDIFSVTCMGFDSSLFPHHETQFTQISAKGRFTRSFTAFMPIVNKL